MRRIVKTVTGPGISAWIPMDFSNLPPTLGFACVPSATATFTVEYTYDDVFNATITPTPFTSTINAATAKIDANMFQPIAALRLNVVASTGSVTLTILSGLKG